MNADLTQHTETLTCPNCGAKIKKTFAMWIWFELDAIKEVCWHCNTHVIIDLPRQPYC